MLSSNLHSRFLPKTGFDLRSKVHVGDTFTVTKTVEKKNTYNPTHNPDDNVLSTPQMIDMIEYTCYHDLEKRLPPHYSTVGFYVDITHKKPVPIGSKVKITAKVADVSAKKTTFKTNVFCGDELVGSGTHKRAVIQFK